MNTYLRTLLIVLGVIAVGALGFYLLPGENFVKTPPGGRLPPGPVAPPQPPPPPTQPFLAVMIENHGAARPFHRGLAEAQIVYEALAEGGITRFMAIYLPGQYPEKVGPIRSARDYFLDWAHEYNAIYVHVGGSDSVMPRLRREDIRDADQFFYDNYFRRENVGRVALEHTMFSTREFLEKLVSDKNWGYLAPGTKPAAPSLKNFETYPAASRINLTFGSFPNYNSAYTYDPISETYKRFNGGSAHIDKNTNQQIAPRAVIVQKTDVLATGDAKAHMNIKTIGEGRAFIFYQGRVVSGRWKKTALKDPTLFYADDGSMFNFPDGSTWIEVMGTQNLLTYE